MSLTEHVQDFSTKACAVHSLELEPDASFKHVMELMKDKTDIPVTTATHDVRGLPAARVRNTG